LQARSPPEHRLRTFKHAVRNTDFAISAEIFLHPETVADDLRAQADTLRNYVDAVLLTDNQYGQLHLSPVVAAGILLEHGVDPIVQLASRCRNRIALIGDLLGAGTIGVESLLLVANERVPKGLDPKPKPVMDVSAIELIQTANTIKFDEYLTLTPDFFVGGVVTPVVPEAGWKAEKMREKIDAGAQFLQTRICMNIELMRRYCEFLVAERITQRTSLIGSVAVLRSVEDAHWLRDNRPNVKLTEEIVQRLENADDAEAEGIRICAETIRAMSEVPGIDGVNIVAVGNLEAIPQAIEQSGVNS
jgi:methylenetetrahydrofolate reductase (NADPH)